MKNIGIVEGFFGPEWNNESRLSWASFLKSHQGSFYIYAPKRDQNLRRGWKDEWSSQFIDHIKELSNHFHQEGILFGVGLSPMGLGISLKDEDRSKLKEKISLLKNLGVDILGLFFDDMPVTDNLLSTQKEVVHLANEIYPQGLIFCPSFYTEDPILDKVFGNRPLGYVEGLKNHIPSNVEICWTGPKVISPEISDNYLEQTTLLLGRPPFIWENLYANDGPKNCKFLKVRFFEGRESFIPFIRGMALNLMNQPELSKILYWSTCLALQGLNPEAAFEQSLNDLCSTGFAEFLKNNRNIFLNDGLDKMSEELKQSLLQELNELECPYSKDVKDYLQGFYIVGAECLTD